MVTAQAQVTAATAPRSAVAMDMSTGSGSGSGWFSSIRSLFEEVASGSKLQFKAILDSIGGKGANLQEAKAGLADSQEYQDAIRPFIDRLEELKGDGWITDEQFNFIKAKTLSSQNGGQTDTSLINFDPSDINCYLAPAELEQYVEKVTKLQQDLLEKHNQDVAAAQEEYQFRLGLGIAAGGANGMFDELSDADSSIDDIWTSQGNTYLIHILQTTTVDDNGKRVPLYGYDYRFDKVFNDQAIAYIHENFGEYYQRYEDQFTGGAVADLDELIRVRGKSIQAALRYALQIEGKTVTDDQFNNMTAFFAAVMFAESAGNPEAESEAGARGLMQIMPGTAGDIAKRYASYGLSDQRPPDNTVMGMLYMGFMIPDLVRGGELDITEIKVDGSYGGQLEMFLRAYNAGPAAIEDSRGYDETNRYVSKITTYANTIWNSESFRALIGEEDNTFPAVSPGSPRE